MEGDRPTPPKGGAKMAGAVCPTAERGSGSAAIRASSGAGAHQGATGNSSPFARPMGCTLAEQRLVARVFQRCHAAILHACESSSVPPEFLGALTANESGGNSQAARFEPAVYRHLAAVIAGESPAFGSLAADDLQAKVGLIAHRKSPDYHGQFLNPPFAAQHHGALSELEDESLRELATSWGYTQIMGYHLVGRAGTVPDLLEPAFHFHLALTLLGEFAAHHHLDLTREFAEMFCCWNTGQPYGKCFDTHYVEHGLQRMGSYRELADPNKDGLRIKD